MPRRRLSEVERLARKRNAWNPDQFKKYTGPRGDAKQWQGAAKDILGEIPSDDPFLLVLGLKDLPKTKKELIQARNKAMKAYHPDIGGTDQMAQLVNEAFDHFMDMLD